MRSRTPKKIQTGGANAEDEYNTPSDFFKFLFFDQYLRNTSGSYAYTVANTFKNYLDQYSRSQTLNNTLGKQLFLEEFDNIGLYNLRVNAYSIFQKVLDKKNGFILLSGWSEEPQYGGGHAIILYFEKIQSLLSPYYNVYIVNSGAGIGYHGASRDDGKYPIIIQFENVSVQQIESIYYVHTFLNPSDLLTRSDMLENLNTYIHYSEPALQNIYGIRHIDYIKDRKTNPVTLADEIQKLKRNKYGVDSGGYRLNFDLGDPFWDLIADYYFEASAESKEKQIAIIGEDLFYKCIKRILNGNTNSVILYDDAQLSSTCTFFSSYYFIKHFIFNSSPLFQRFIENIKETEVNEKILGLEVDFDRIKNNTPNEFDNKWINTLNIMSMLLKDVDLSPETKNKIRIILKEKYSLFDWTAPTHLEEVVIPERPPTILLVNTYIERVQSFLTGSKKLDELKDVFDRFYAFFIAEEDQYVIDWSLIVLTKCCLECYNSIGTDNGDAFYEISPEVIQGRVGNEFLIEEYTRHAIKITDICNILSVAERDQPYLKRMNANVYNPYYIIRNIACQCFFHIYKIPDDIDIPFIGTIRAVEDDKEYTIDDNFLKKVILVLYSSGVNISMPYLYGFSFRNIFIELYKKRGLLFSGIPVHDTLDTKLREYFNGEMGYNIFSSISNEFIRYLAAVNIVPTPSVLSDQLKDTFILTSGRQFPHEQGGGNNIFTRNEFVNEDMKRRYYYKGKTAHSLHIIMSTMTDINTVISLLNFGDISTLDISGVRHFNILINGCNYLCLKEYGYPYERDDMEDIITRTPPTNITNLNYIKNYFKVDKRNDLIKTAIENLNTDSFIQNCKFLPNKVYESLLYLLYLYKNEFVITNKKEFLKYLNKENILFHILNDDLYKAYKKNLDIVYETNNQNDYNFRKKKKGDAFYKTRDDYLIYNIVLNSSVENIIKAIRQTNERNEIVDEEYEPVYIYPRGSPIPVIQYPLYKKRNTQEITELYYYRKSIPNRIENQNGTLIKKFGTEEYRLIEIDQNFIDIINYYNSGLRKVVIKLAKIDDILVWYHNDIYIIELINYEKSYFKYNLDTKKIVFVDESDTEYSVYTDKYEAMLGVWLVGTTNIFLLETKAGIKKLLVLMSKKILNLYQNYYSKATKGYGRDPITFLHTTVNYHWYWASIKSVIVANIVKEIKNTEVIFESTYSIVHIHHTYLSLETNKYDTLISLFISYQYANNYVALNLLHATIENIYGIEEKKIKKYSFLYDTFTKILKSNMDNPAWGLYIDSASSDYNPARDMYYKKENPSIEMIQRDYRLGLLDGDLNYIQVKKTSEKFAEIRKKLEFPDSISNSNNNSHKIAALKKFLEDFRYSCDPVKPCSVDPIEAAIHPSPRPPPPETIPSSPYEFDVIFNELLYNRNTNEKSISFLYLTHWSVFYKNLIYIKYKQIWSILHSKKLCDDRELCGYIIKMLEPLDSELLYSWNELRRIEDILFELQNGNFIRKKQKDILEGIYQEDAIDAIVANEILMGQGKTSTITPMIILHEYYKKIANQEEPPRYFFVILPSHLVLDSYKIVFTLINILPNFTARKETPCLVTMDSSKEKFLKDTNDELRIVEIISDTRMKENLLKRILDSSDEEENTEYKKNLAKPNFFIFDEVDSLINPLKSDLNIPENTTKGVHEKNSMILSICFTIIQNYIYKKVATPVPGANVTIKHGASILYSNKHDETLAPLIQNKIKLTFSQILSMQYNQNFGFGAYIDNNKKNHFVAIPYSANLTPIEESEFTDFELFVMLTVYSYLSNKIRKIDIDIAVNYIYDKIHSFDEILQEKIMFPIIIKGFFPEIGHLLEESYMDIYNLLKINNPYDTALLRIESKINETPENKLAFLNFYLSRIVFPKFVKIYKEQNNISMVDIFNPTISNKKVTFSGTVNLNKPGTLIKDDIVEGGDSKKYWGGQISNIKIDATVEASIEAAFYGITVSRTPELIIGEEDSPEEKLITYVKARINDTTKKYGALIDTAGIILKTEPEELVRILYEDIKSTNLDAANKKVFLFVTKDDRRRFIKEGKLFEYNNETFNDLFIYYDHKHCVGTDFKQPFKIHGLVTIKNKNNLTEIAQGIFRLRFVNIGHSIDFYLKEAIPKVSVLSGLKKNKALYKYLEENDKKFLESSNKESKLQCSKYVYRKAKNLDSESYLEKIFFDLMPIDEYKNYAEFIEYMFNKFKTIITYKQALIDELKQKNSVSTAVSQNLAIEEQVDAAVDIQVDIQVNTQLIYERNLELGNIRKILTIENYYNHTLPNRFVEITKIADELNTEWSIFVSMPVFYKIESNLSNLEFNDNTWYYLYNSKYQNSILIITYYEVVVLMNIFTVGKNPLADTISILDSYGNYFRDKGKIDFPNVLKLLFMEKTVNLIDKMDSLLNYCKYNSAGKTAIFVLESDRENPAKEVEATHIQSIDYLFGFNYTFHGFECKDDSGPNNKTTWMDLIDLPSEVGGREQELLFLKLQEKYNEKHKILPLIPSPQPPSPQPPAPQPVPPPEPPVPLPIGAQLAPAKTLRDKLSNLSNKIKKISKIRRKLTQKIRKNLNMIGAGRYTKRK